MLLDTLTLALANAYVYLRHPVNILRFWYRVGYLPKVATPRRFSEKLLWRKVFDHNPAFETFCDKLKAKEYTEAADTQRDIPETLWVGTDPEQIPPELLDSPVAIKANHGCGYNLFPEQGRPLDASQKRRLQGWLRRAYGRSRLEWGYRSVERRIFVEALVHGGQPDSLVDLSVHAVSGEAILIEAIVGAKTRQQQKGYFKLDGSRWPELEKSGSGADPKRRLPPEFELPSCYLEAVASTSTLGDAIDYARFDYLVVGARLYAGEITVYPGSGLSHAVSFKNYNAHVGRCWDISRSWFLKTRHTGCTGWYARALRRWLQQQGTAGTPAWRPSLV